MKSEYCELCYAPAQHKHHWHTTRGAGGPLIPENEIMLCAKCHNLAHNTATAKYMRNKAAMAVTFRENKDMAEIINIITAWKNSHKINGV